MTPEPGSELTEQSIPEFLYLERLEQARPSPAPSEQIAMAEPAPPRAPSGAAGPVRVAVLYRQGQEQAAIGIATVIDTYQNEKLSQGVGKPVQVAYISRAQLDAQAGNLVRYRVGMLKAALQLATVLPGDQALEPMSEEEGAHAAVDVIIYLGASLR
jgi:hypothetical protein